MSILVHIRNTIYVIGLGLIALHAPAHADDTVLAPHGNYHNWSRACFEALLLPEYLGCMTPVHERLGKQITSDLADATASLTKQQQTTYRNAVTLADEKIPKTCWDMIASYGPGSLNNRRHPLCLNDGRVGILERIHNDLESFLAPSLKEEDQD